MAIRLTKAPSHVRVAIRLTPSSFISEWEPFLILFLSPLFQTLDVNLFSGSLVLLTVKVIGRRVGFLIILDALPIVGKITPFSVILEDFFGGTITIFKKILLIYNGLDRDWIGIGYGVWTILKEKIWPLPRDTTFGESIILYRDK